MRAPSLLLVFIALALALGVTANLPIRHARSHPSKLSSPLDVPRTVLYTRTAAPVGWTVGSVASPSTPLTFTIIVEGGGGAELERLFWSVSDPSSPAYGDFLTGAEVVSLVTPCEVELRALYSSLSAHGIDRAAVVSHGDSFDVTTTVEAASSLFNTTFYTFHHTHTMHKAVRQMGPCSLPTAMTNGAKVLLVLDVHTFPTIEQRRHMAAQRKAQQSAMRERTSAANAPTTPAWVPQAVSSIYGVPFPIKPASTPMVNAGVIEWVEEVFSPKDLVNFSTNVAIPLTPVDQHHIVGNNTEVPSPGTEAELDIQWIEGINPGFTPWFWIVSDPTKWMYTFTVEFLQATEYPSIISLSYGLPETLQCSEWGNSSDCNGAPYSTYIKVVDKQWMKIGLIGVSIIVCSQVSPSTNTLSLSTPSHLDYPACPCPFFSRPSSVGPSFSHCLIPLLVFLLCVTGSRCVFA